MIFAETPQTEVFRQNVRRFFSENVTTELRNKGLVGNYLGKADFLSWQQSLHRQGWGAPHWPARHGGANWSAVQTFIFEEESAASGAPIPIALRNGTDIVGPLIIAHGTSAQKQRYLDPIISGQHIWALGFSEPDAGSDLANLRCNATREGDEYIVNGTKIWTSLAHWAAHCLLLVRTATSSSKHQGITVLLVDLSLPGITIRPIDTIDGNHHLNQVFYDNVRVPAHCRLGEEGKGWNMISEGLGAERLFLADVGLSKALLVRLKQIAAVEIRKGRPLCEHTWFRDRLALLEIRLHALDHMVLRLADLQEAIRPMDASLLKMRGTELTQDIGQLMSEAAGLYALPHFKEALESGLASASAGPPHAALLTPFHLFWRKATISGGTSEIQKNIIAREILGRGANAAARQ